MSYAYGSAQWRPRPGTTPTDMDLRVLAACLVMGRDEAAHALGRHRSTVRLHIRSLFVRLQVTEKWEAAHALGWLRIPAEYQIGVGLVPESSRGLDGPTPTMEV